MGANGSKRIRELRERRIRLAEERENRRKRMSVGPSVVGKINAALGSRLTLDDFEVEAALPVEFARQPSFLDCVGLVAAYVSEEAVREIATCCDSVSGPMEGRIGFDEYAYLGTARAEAVTLASLLGAAKVLHDSVLFCPDGSGSVVLLDHYRAGGVPRDEGFSFIVQRGQLERDYASCFRR